MTSPWLAVFDHHFVDASLTNCRYFAGTVTFSPFTPEVKLEPAANGIQSYAALSSSPPRWFRYVPAPALLNIVGIELNLSVRLPRFIGAGYSFVLAQSDGWECRIQDGGRVEVVSIGQSTGWNGFQHSPQVWLDIQWSWRIAGQSFLRVNGALVAAAPNVNAGVRQTMSFLWVGVNVIDTPGPPGPLPPTRARPFQSVDIRRVRVRLLTEDRIKKSMDSHLALTALERESLAGCKDVLEGHVEAILAVLRRMMASVARSTTRAWVKEDGGSPVDRSGQLIHKHAQEAARAAIGFLNGNDSDLLRFRSNIDAFFRHLARILAGDSVLTTDLTRLLAHNYALPIDCRRIVDRLRTGRSRELHRLDTLVATFSRAVETGLGIRVNG